MPGLSNVDLTTFAGDTVNARCYQVKFILDGPKETGDLPRQKAYSFHVMSLRTFQGPSTMLL